MAIRRDLNSFNASRGGLSWDLDLRLLSDCLLLGLSWRLLSDSGNCLLVALGLLEELGGASGALDSAQVARVDKLAPLVLAGVAVIGALGSAVRVADRVH